jgi:hypothetical protein
MNVIQIPALLFASTLVSALPFYQVVRDLPADVVSIAHDEKNGLYIAYNVNGSLHGTYSDHVARSVNLHERDNGASCVKLSVDEAKTR